MTLTWIHFFLLKEKAPYEEKAANRKAEYEKQMDAYNKNMVSPKPYYLLTYTNTYMANSNILAMGAGGRK